MTKDLRVVVTTGRLHRPALDRLQSRAAVRQTDDQTELAGVIAAFDPHAILSRTLTITAPMVASAASLRVISKHGAGTDNIAIEAATDRRIPVFFTRGANARSVAEHTIGLIFALARNVARHDRALRGGTWSRFLFPAHELMGKRLAIVGFGQAGRIVAELAQVIGMSVAFYDPALGDDPAPAWATRFGSLPDMLAEADVVSLHCPLTSSTRRLMNADAFAAMKPGAWVVNTARGEIVDEGDLLAALQSGQLGGAALDCFSSEPAPADHPFYGFSNVVLTPHVAGSTLQSAQRVAEAAVDNIFSVFDGTRLDRRSLMNPSVLD